MGVLERGGERGKKKEKSLQKERSFFSFSPPLPLSLSLFSPLSLSSTLTSCGDLAYSTSTGKVLPGIWNTGASPKNAANRAASRVAEVTTSLKSRGLRAATAFKTPKSTSVLSERSWASSMMMAE